MLSKTHIAIGLASAITILAPETTQELCPVIVGASWGSIICDIDCKFSKSKDAVLGRSMAGLLSAGAIYIDMTSQGKMFEAIMKTHILSLVVGLLIILMTGYCSRESEHRGFSHSLLAFALYDIGLFMFSKPLLLPFIIGFASHLLMDLMNYRPVHILFPYKKGFSLKCFKAKSKQNIAIMIAGYAWLAAACYIFWLQCTN